MCEGRAGLLFQHSVRAGIELLRTVLGNISHRYSIDYSLYEVLNCTSSSRRSSVESIHNNWASVIARSKQFVYGVWYNCLSREIMTAIRLADAQVTARLRLQSPIWVLPLTAAGHLQPSHTLASV